MSDNEAPNVECYVSSLMLGKLSKLACLHNIEEIHREKLVNLEILNAKQCFLREEDIRSIVEIECHPKVREWVYTYVDPDIQKETQGYQDFFTKLPTNKKVDILVAKCEGITIGFLALWKLGTYMEHVASIGISVHPDYWGRGIATELVKSAIELAKKSGIRRLEVETLRENASMRHVVERLGFTLESLRKCRIKKGGAYHDEVSYFKLL